MRKESLEFLKKLMEAPSPSGFEQPAQEVIREEMIKYADEVKTDVLGNVIGVKNPKGKPRVMLAGHCDEVGFMVKYITDEGFIYFTTIGGVDAHIVPGHRVRIYTEKGPVLGVVGKKAIHLMEEEERKKIVEINKQWIDIGAKDKKEAENLVSVGDPIVFDVEFRNLQGDLVTSRGFDDKMGSFVVTEALRLVSDKKFEAAVYAVSTVQEEVGLRGATTSGFGIEPDVGIAVDVDHSTDYPEVDKKRVGEKKIGGGPVLHKGANINPVVGQMLINIAKEKKIPFQISGEPGRTGTDAAAIQIARSGVATGLISVPLRYMHTPCEILSLSDLEAASKLLAEFILKLTPNINFIP